MALATIQAVTKTHLPDWALPAGRSVRLQLHMNRYCHTPSYVQPI
jgi:hypothetical protein